MNRYTHMKRGEEINIVQECREKLESLEAELDVQSCLTEFYIHAILTTALAMLSFAVPWESYHLSIALIPMLFYFYIRFLKFRKLREQTKTKLDIVKERFKSSYGL